MTLMQRIEKILGALAMILAAVMVLKAGDQGFILIALILFASLLIAGLRLLVFYFTMGRHMVDGRTSLYKGLILLDLGAFLLTSLNDPKMLIVLYLLGANAFSGVIDILRALEARNLQSPSWRLNFVGGVIGIAFAVAALVCGVFLKDMRLVAQIYVAGLLWEAAVKLISAFWKTAIVYIP